MWLLSKRRDESALKSLRWLRGWVPQNVVQNEFDSIKRYKETSSSCEECKTSATKCTHSAGQTTGEAIKELFRQKTLKPFTVLMSIYTVAYFAGKKTVKRLLYFLFKKTALIYCRNSSHECLHGANSQSISITNRF